MATPLVQYAPRGQGLTKNSAVPGGQLYPGGHSEQPSATETARSMVPKEPAAHLVWTPAAHQDPLGQENSQLLDSPVPAGHRNPSAQGEQVSSPKSL